MSTSDFDERIFIDDEQELEEPNHSDHSDNEGDMETMEPNANHNLNISSNENNSDDVTIVHEEMNVNATTVSLVDVDTSPSSSAAAPVPIITTPSEPSEPTSPVTAEGDAAMEQQQRELASFAPTISDILTLSGRNPYQMDNVNVSMARSRLDYWNDPKNSHFKQGMELIFGHIMQTNMLHDQMQSRLDDIVHREAELQRRLADDSSSNKRKLEEVEANYRLALDSLTSTNLEKHKQKMKMNSYFEEVIKQTKMDHQMQLERLEKAKEFC